MLIDFHAHYFPEETAKESLEKLASKAGVPCFGDGTRASVLDFMRQDGVTLTVNQPVATKPEQVPGINRRMVEANRDPSGIVCFGSMYPGYEWYEEELRFLSSSGIRGIKLHSEYQDFYPEDPKHFPLYQACAKNSIALLFHAGMDLVYTTVHCKPSKMLDLLSIRGITIILAHMGGYRMWDEVEEYLVGRKFYFDLAYCAEMDNVQLRRMILRHGSDKILFATDFPWERASNMKAKVDSLGLPARDLENIYFRNALQLLGRRG